MTMLDLWDASDTEEECRDLLAAVFEAVDVAAQSRAEVERAAGRIIAIEGGRWTANDVDCAIGMRVDEVAAQTPDPRERAVLVGATALARRRARSSSRRIWATSSGRKSGCTGAVDGAGPAIMTLLRF